MTYRALLLSAVRTLSGAGVPNPETDAAMLMSFLTGRNPLELRLDMDTGPDAKTESAFSDLLRRRAAREPLQYLIGSVPFCGLSFHVDSRVLIPRPETGLLTEWAAEELRPLPAPSILDLCCGSGCIGLTLKSRFPHAHVMLTDISGDALAVAKENARMLELNAAFVQGDLFSSVHGSFDLIISNPPYIPSDQCASLQTEVLYEPSAALDGGQDGLDFYRRIVAESRSFLREEGRLMLEVGFDEADKVHDLLNKADFHRVEIRKDLSGIDRMLMACK